MIGMVFIRTHDLHWLKDYRVYELIAKASKPLKLSSPFVTVLNPLFFCGFLNICITYVCFARAFSGTINSRTSFSWRDPWGKKKLQKLLKSESFFPIDHIWKLSSWVRICSVLMRSVQGLFKWLPNNLLCFFFSSTFLKSNDDKLLKCFILVRRKLFASFYHFFKIKT